MIKCKFCGHEFDEALGKYGCPNCLGEGLEKRDKTHDTRKKNRK